MFDVSSRITYKNVPNWHRDIVRVCENVPIVLCGNKVDCTGFQKPPPLKESLRLFQIARVFAQMKFENGGEKERKDDESGARHDNGLVLQTAVVEKKTEQAMFTRLPQPVVKTILSFLLSPEENGVTQLHLTGFARMACERKFPENREWFLNSVSTFRTDRLVKPKQITFHRKKNLQYYDISCYSNYNFEKPFLYLARKLIGDPNLCFVETPLITVPEVTLTPEMLVAYEAELRMAGGEPLPDEDDDF
jgi:hypothetical protein